MSQEHPPYRGMAQRTIHDNSPAANSSSPVRSTRTRTVCSRKRKALLLPPLVIRLDWEQLHHATLSEGMTVFMVPGAPTLSQYPSHKNGHGDFKT